MGLASPRRRGPVSRPHDDQPSHSGKTVFKGLGHCQSPDLRPAAPQAVHSAPRPPRRPPPHRPACLVLFHTRLGSHALCLAGSCPPGPLLQGQDGTAICRVHSAARRSPQSCLATPLLCVQVQAAGPLVDTRAPRMPSHLHLRLRRLKDIYWLAQCLYLTAQYHRAAHALRSRRLDKLYEACRYLAARCHYAAKEHQQALDILDMEEPINKRLFEKRVRDDSGPKEPRADWEVSPSSIQSSICLLRGKIYDALDNRALAACSYKEALRLDVCCFEAFDLLTSHHMLTAQEEKELLESLPLSKLCAEEQELLRFLFENKLKKYNKPSETVAPEAADGLQENLDVAVSLAERHYYNCDFKTCYKLTSV
ncbi:PREDICTED: cell division cycle protein 16 homolog [Condylura cristata]|uniref:cell division cycle protein 16 homolog n=1 Tax=Condylura cristata TaxID=143302 RepID=UPI0006429D8F|nr:PREDICTED: cell division cycle protein 16 homolog [Condylura cristata]